MGIWLKLVIKELLLAITYKDEVIKVLQLSFILVWRLVRPFIKPKNINTNTNLKESRKN
jgi:hypothetical protein